MRNYKLIYHIFKMEQQLPSTVPNTQLTKGWNMHVAEY